MKKLLKWVVLGMIVLFIVVVLSVLFGLDGIIRKGVEVGATNSLNLQTTLGGADVSLLGGSLSLSDLQIASPPGFQAPRMFTLGGAKLGVSLGNLRNDPIGIDQIVIEKPNVVVEQVGGKFNFQVLMDQQSKEPAPPPQPTGKREPGQPIRMIIHDLQLNNATVVLRPGIPGLQQEINVPIQSLQMKDVGRGEGNKNGAAIKDVVVDVMSALAKKAADSKDVPPEVRQLLSLNADQVKQQLSSEMTKAIDKKLGEGAGQAVQKELGGLLGGKPTTQGR